MNYGKKGVSKKKKSVNSKSKQIGKKASVIFLKAFMVCMLAVVVVGVSAGVGIIKGVVDNAPDITSDSVIPRGYKSVVLDSAGNKTADLIAEGSNRIWVNIDQIPEHVQHAFVAVEDERFYEHNGIDIKGIIRAGIRGVAKGFKFNEGASTITQQLLKNSVFDFMSEDGFAEKMERKLQEQYLAIKLEQEIMTKEEILEAYLNTINLGQNTLGIQAAANRYFGKDVSELTISEAAVIAGITKNPVYNNPISYPDKNRERQEIVLNDMLEQEYISKEEYDAALADDVYSRIKNVNETAEAENIYSYYVDATIKEVLEDLQEYKGYTYQQAYNALYYGGLTIESAQDPEIQAIMDEELQNEENYPDRVRVGLEYALTVQKPNGDQINYSKENMIKYFRETENKDFDLVFDDKESAQAHIDAYKDTVVEEGDTVYERIDFTVQPQASMVVMEQETGIVKGIVGGRGTKEASLTLNRATDTVRQPGSTFKIVSTYAPALDMSGMTLATTQFDAPYAYRNGRNVRNWNGEAYQGWTTLRRGIEQSMNIVAVKTITDITPDLAYTYLLDFGFTSIVGEADENGMSDINQSTSLGGLTHGVTNLELTTSYATIANKGVYTEPVFYTRILDHDGNVLIEKDPVTKTVLKDTTAWLLTSAMKDVVTQGTGTAARFTGMTIAGKTGTTSQNNDVWFVGYTPYYTAGVWAGFDNNHKLSKGETNYHKVIWKKVMSRIHEELPNKDFDMPEDITSATVCNQSGKLPIPGICDGCRRTEYFAKGTVPTEFCDVHVVGTACIESNQLATDLCPGVEARIITLYPADNQASSSSASTRNLTAPICSLHPGNLIGGVEPGALPGGEPEEGAVVDTGEPPPQ
ncbi:MAG: glycosyl transferase [Lachnospiraceae bacterium]|nr:glycosyl transferase [Lachnospiraceae bacterium]